MKPEAIRVAIHEALGWRKTRIVDDRHGNRWPVWERGNGGVSSLYTDTIPHYEDDLNGMHEAEKTLEGMACQNYELWLTGFMRAEHFIEDKKPDCYTFHATAAQRAEAFLRTIGKWTDD